MKTGKLPIHEFSNTRRPKRLSKVLATLSNRRKRDQAAHPSRHKKTLKAVERAWDLVPTATLGSLLSWVNYEEPYGELWQLSDKQLRDKFNDWSCRQKRKKHKKNRDFF